MGIFFTYNDKDFKEGTAVITPDSRSLRYGDGLFETMKTVNGSIQLGNYHFERLFSGLKRLQFEIPKYFSSSFLEKKIAELCKKNNHGALVRVRLMVFRGNGGLFDPSDHLPNYIIQTWRLTPEAGLNSNGLIIDIYPDAIKVIDGLANLKSNSFLPYTMAALHAKKLLINDCVLLNNHHRICDTSIANIYIIKGQTIFTPPLSEGCIAGVTRRFILETLTTSGFKIEEKPLTTPELENAEEVFLSNSIRGIRWVKQFRNNFYTNSTVVKIHEAFTKTIY